MILDFQPFDLRTQLEQNAFQYLRIPSIGKIIVNTLAFFKYLGLLLNKQ
jgi:hypothetical protein